MKLKNGSDIIKKSSVRAFNRGRGEWQMRGRSDTTIYDISQRAGVSIATVSRVINRSVAVSEKTRERVLQVMEESGYTPNAFARGLGLNTMKTIGLLCADVSDAFMAEAISFLEKELRNHGYDSLLCCTGTLMKNRKKSLELLLSKHVDGVILVGSNYVSMEREHNTYILSAAHKKPIIILNARLDGENVYCAYCDDKAATMSATQKLLEDGKRRVLYLYHARTYSGMKKLEGYKQAHEHMGVPFQEELVVECSTGDGIQEIQALLEGSVSKGLAFDAIMTATDDMAVGALKYARAAHRTIPEDLQIVGFNNSSLCLCTEPELSSVDNKLQSLCQNCVSTLMGVLEGKDMPKYSIFSGELVRRGTTA